MNLTSLNPSVAGKLSQVSRRRFWMICLRGICAALVTFAVCMVVVGFLDWRWILSENLRWSLSAAVYLGTVAVAWLVAGRRLIHSPTQEEIAAQIETSEPKLREQLLSAVELATDDPNTIGDSPVFRGLLQGKVAQQMEGINAPTILPATLLLKWLGAAVIIAGGLAVLLMAGGPQVRSLAVRAIMPMANIDRVSRIKVEVLEPTPSSLMIAKDDTVAIVVSTSGGHVEEAILETIVDGKTAVQQTMRARTKSEFAANIQVEQDKVQYRILAGDAVTKRYTITSKDRPRVLSFEKEFRYPEYSGMADQTLTEDHGDLVVLQGTAATIALELNQDIAEAELRVNGSSRDEVSVIPLTKNETGRWEAVVSVDEESIYKVHLVSKETGFENKFSPRYEIRPLPDLIPRAGFVDQTETNLLLPPNDILALEGMAEDDLPLQTLEQEISVNGRKWIVVPLDVVAQPALITDEERRSSKVTTAANSHRITSRWNWDLLNLQLKTGDQVTTRLVATDRKGNRGESVPLTIVVSSPEFDPDRHAVMERRAALIRSFNQFAVVTQEHKASAIEIIKRLQEAVKKGKPEDLNEAGIALDCTTLKELAAKIQQLAQSNLQQVLEVTQAMPGGVYAYELDLSGRLLARIAADHTNRPIYAIEQFAAANQLKDKRSLVTRIKEGFDRSADDAKNVAYHYRHLVSQDIFSALACDLDAMLQQQKLIVNSPTQTFARLRRQQTVVLNQLQIVEGLAKDQRANVPEFLTGHLDQLVDWTDRWIDKLDRSMESEDRVAELRKDVANLFRELGDRQRYDVIDGGMATRLHQARRDFDYRSGSLVEPLSQMSTATDEETRRLIEASKANDSATVEKFTTEAIEFASAIDVKLRPSLEQLRMRRSLSQSRIDSDPEFAADAGMTHRAVNSLLNLHRSGDPASSIVPTAFREIAPAYRILEAGHDVANVSGLLKSLIQFERWNSQEFIVRTAHPVQWDAVNKGLEEAVNRLRQAGIRNEVVALFDRARWSTAAQEANRKLTERRWKRDQNVSAARDLAELDDALQQANAGLQPVLVEARAVIAKYAPTISKMAEQLAANVRELEKQTTHTADAIEQPQLAEFAEADSHRKLAELESQQENINQRIDDLFEALVEDANQQNLTNDAEKERARDADDSIALIQLPADQMNQAMQEAQQANAAETQAEKLSDAAEQQEKTAQAIEKIAQHFEKLDSGEDVAKSREALRQAERDMGLARQMDQRFEDVNPLNQMTVSTESSLMEQLEAELENNRAMQEALSEIAQKTVQEAQTALADAANQERELQKANERSDAEFKKQKKQIANELRELGRDASNLSNRLVAQAESAAAQAKTPEAKQQFEQTRQQLSKAANAANSSNDGQLLAELTDKTNAVQKAIREASKAIDLGKQKSTDAKAEEIHGNEKERQNAKRNLQNQQKRFLEQLKREADQEAKRRDSDVRRQAANVRNAENNLKNLDRSLQQIKKRSQKEQDNQSLKNQVQQAESRKQQAQQKVDQAKQEEQKAQQRKNEAREERNKLNSLPQPSLDDKNPAAQLAESMATEAARQAADLQKRVDKIAEKMNFSDELTPQKQQLAQAAKKQRDVSEDVAATSEDLARAARHERRLKNDEASKTLQESADGAKSVVENESMTAEQKLQTAEGAAAETSSNTASASDTKAASKAAIAAHEALAASEDALEIQADRLGAIVDAAATAAAEQQQQSQAGDSASGDSPGESAGQPTEPSAASNVAATGQQNAGSSQPTAATPPTLTADERAVGQQLARALDELDLAQSQSTQLAQSAETRSQKPTSSTAASQVPQSLAQAALAKAAQLAQQRSQSLHEGKLAKNSNSFNSEGMPQLERATDDFAVLNVDRSEDEDWGKLRGKEAEDLTKGGREAVSAEYRKSVEAYFKVIAERARRAR